MKVLITGANGLLGVNLARELIKSNIEVKAFVRHSANLKGLHNVPCQICRGDMTSFDDVCKALSDCDCVVHAGSTTSILPVDFEFYERINVESTKNIIKAVLNQENKRMVYVSAGNVFGPGSKENPGTELSSFTLGSYDSGYINSKHLAQQHVLDAVKNKGLNAVIINPTFIIGPYDVKPSSGKIILYGLKHGVQWYPPGGKNFVYVGDVCQGILGALNFGRKGDCYLIAGENLTYKEFFSELNKIAGRNRVQIAVPAILLSTIGAVVEAWNKITGQTNAFNKTNSRLATIDNYYSAEKAIRELNITPTPVKRAIEEALEWFKKENYITDDNYSTHGTSFDL
jgi:dihydroflavonol-4-reductase